MTLNGHSLSIEELWQVATLQAPCALADEARPLIRRSRQLVELLAAQPRAIMLARANGLARGCSGIREELIDLLRSEEAQQLCLPPRGAADAD